MEDLDIDQPPQYLIDAFRRYEASKRGNGTFEAIEEDFDGELTAFSDGFDT